MPTPYCVVHSIVVLRTALRQADHCKIPTLCIWDSVSCLTSDWGCIIQVFKFKDPLKLCSSSDDSSLLAYCLICSDSLTFGTMCHNKNPTILSPPPGNINKMVNSIWRWICHQINTKWLSLRISWSGFLTERDQATSVRKPSRVPQSKIWCRRPSLIAVYSFKYNTLSLMSSA